MQDYFSQSSEFDSELVIGLVSAAGSQNALVIDLLKERLGLAGYCVEVIKVSKDIIPFICPVPPPGADEYTRITGLMDAGNQARQKTNDNAILADGIAARIYASRKKDTRKKQTILPRPKTAFIVDSLKRPEEVVRLRLIYPSGFILTGVHSEESQRRKHLIDNRGIREEHADDLIHRDGDEISEPYGQRVNQTFHLADFFVRVASNFERLRCDVKRMVDLWFGNPFITPTFDEHAMFMAFAAALRSADLSRQVGAVVTRDSQILSTGANECPRAGGGLYWPTRLSESEGIGDVPDGRDYMRADGDSNRAEQNRLIEQIVQAGEQCNSGLNTNTLRKLLQDSGICDLTEFGRVVHAEMEALLSCARTGLSTIGSTLYSTTFPCHNCAKHIIAAGVKRVVYVEPYPKSKTFQFHDDAISRPGEEMQSKVRFDPFVGIGPRRFFDLFSMNLSSSYPLIRKIKETGKPVDWSIASAQLRIQMKPVSYLELEATAGANFAQHTN